MRWRGACDRGPRGPRGAPGATGPTGPELDTCLLPFSGTAHIDAGSYSGEFLISVIANGGVTSIDNLLIAPCFPIPGSAVADMLASDVKALEEGPTALPAGLELIVRLVRDGAEATALETVYPSDTVFPNGILTPGEILRTIADVPLAYPETFDVHVILRNGTGDPIEVGSGITLAVSATIRVRRP